MPGARPARPTCDGGGTCPCRRDRTRRCRPRHCGWPWAGAPAPGCPTRTPRRCCWPAARSAPTADFFFYNQPSHSSGAARHEGKRQDGGRVTDTLLVDLTRVQPGIQTVILAASSPRPHLRTGPRPLHRGEGRGERRRGRPLRQHRRHQSLAHGCGFRRRGTRTRGRTCAWWCPRGTRRRCCPRVCRRCSPRTIRAGRRSSWSTTAARTAPGTWRGSWRGGRAVSRSGWCRRASRRPVDRASCGRCGTAWSWPARGTPSTCC
ncbi:hypothetical protein STENM223S_11037 [Streptomyces tendae]